MAVEIFCSLTLITIALLVVKLSIALVLSVVTGLGVMVVWVPSTIVWKLLGCDTICCLWGKQLATTVEDEDGTAVGAKPMYRN